MEVTHDVIRTVRQLRETYQRDRHRPIYHFTTPEDLCLPFDPNGALFWKGRYHLFYIFQDHDLPQGGHCWDTRPASIWSIGRCSPRRWPPRRAIRT